MDSLKFDPAGGLAPRRNLEWDAFRNDVKTNWRERGEPPAAERQRH